MNASLRIVDWQVEAAGQTLIDGVDVHFAAQRVWGVVGRSGAGKSVLLKSALGLMPARAGFVELSLGGDHIRAEPDHPAAFARIRQHVAFVPQDPALMDDLTAQQNVAFAISRLGRHASARVQTEVQMWLERFGLTPIAGQIAARLSPGQQRKVALCRALALAPTILVLDEPTTGLDLDSAAEITTSLQELATQGTTLIVISHDVRCLRALSPDLVWVDQGRIGYQGPYPQDRTELPPELVPLVFGAFPAVTGPLEVAT